MIEFYIKKMNEATKLSEAKNYAKAAGVDLDVVKWIKDRYFQ